MIERITQEEARDIKFKQKILTLPFVYAAVFVAFFPLCIIIYLITNNVFEKMIKDNLILLLVSLGAVFIVATIFLIKYIIGFSNFIIYNDKKEKYFEDLSYEEPEDLARDFNVAKEAYKNEDYRKAFYMFEELSQFNFMLIDETWQLLAFMYENGLGCKQDYNEAFKYYKLAANSSAQAQNDLANMYENGFGVTQNYAQALKWYKFSAQNGFTEAKYNIGLIYEVVKKDYKEALKWYKLAYESRDKENILILKEGSLAYTSKDAKARFDKLKKQIDEEKLNKKDSFEEALKLYRAKDYEKAFNIFIDLSTKEDARALNMLGVMNENAQGCKQDYNEALRFYNLAIEKGSQEAKNSLEKLYQKVISNLEISFEAGIRAFEAKNYKRSLEIFQSLKDEDKIKSYYYLAKIYDEFDSKNEALKYYLLATKNGDARAQVILGEKFLDQKNYPNAIKCFTMAAKNENKEALRNLGIMYFKAYGVKEDKQKALQFLKQAVKLGDEKSKKLIITMFMS